MIEPGAARRVVGGKRVLAGEVVCALVGIAYLMAVDPRDPRAWAPGCPTKLFTGLDCPACGSLRLGHDLLHGHAGAAVQDNLFVLLCSPLLAYLVTCHWRAVRLGRPVHVPRRLAYGLVSAAVAWTAVRNLPRWPLKPAA